MNGQDEIDSKQEASKRNEEISLSFEDVHDIIMKIENNFLREILLLVLGEDDEPEKVFTIAKFSIHLLLKQQNEVDEFWERIQRGEVTIRELELFCLNRWHSIYCVVCFEKINNTDKVVECSSCKLCFHEQCFKEGGDFGDKCIACKVCN